MSLINEALKKAQRQRTEDPVIVPSSTGTAPGIGSGAAPRIPKRRPPMPARTVILLIGGSALLVMAGLLGFVMLHDADTPASPSRPVVARTTPAPGTDAPLGSPLTPSGKTNSATPAPVVLPPPIVPAPAPSIAVIATPAPVIQAPTAAPTSAPMGNVAEVRLPSVIVPPAVTPAPTQPPGSVEVFNRPVVAAHSNGFAGLAPTPNPKVYEFLQALKITGIRVSETDPKVIMNDRVFRLNDLVDKSTQIRLLKVTASSLTFVDVNGVEYQKSF